ncbi:glycosyltransferase family 4 protein [Devosia sp. LjRoot16]|uniref:glycosyltransferase family 4 protein n=1 Tax=Devosia sp. LjRoot16 TaxID=3342271 RepID=UPI003ECDD7E4
MPTKRYGSAGSDRSQFCTAACRCLALCSVAGQTVRLVVGAERVAWLLRIRSVSSNRRPEERYRQLRVLIANIVYATPSDPRVVGGAEVSTKALAEGLVARGHEVVVFRGHDSKVADADENVEGVRVVSRDIRNFYWPFDGVVRVKASKAMWHIVDNLGLVPRGLTDLLDEFAPEVVHTNNLIGLSWGVWREAAKRNIPIVHVLRDYYLVCGRSARFRNGRICTSTCAECRVATFARGPKTVLVDAVIGNSKAILDTHLEAGLFVNAKIRTNIVNIAERRAVRVVRSEDGFVTFGYIGRASSEKGLELLAKAFGRMQGNVKLVIAGETRPEVRQRLVAEAGREIDFMGFVAPDEFYSRVDVVVVPSLWAEPLPRAVLEAFSYGRPVIASERGGIPEAVGTAGGGWLFNPDSVDDLVAIMNKVASERTLTDKAALQAFESARRFSAENVTEAHLAVLRAVTVK